MHHIAYKLMRGGDRKHPKVKNTSSPRSRQRLRQPDELIRPSSPTDSEATNQEQHSRLRLENETLKRNLEIKEIEVTSLKEDIDRLQERLKSTDLTQENGDSELENVSDEIGDRLMALPKSFGPQHHQELVIVGDALSSLRRCFDPSDPYQHTIETVEQSVRSLWERVVSAENGAVDGECKSNLDMTRDDNRGSITSIIGLPQSSLSSFSGISNEVNTKLVYYTTKSTTPFVSFINKRLGEITLRDVKLSLDRPGQFRYHFKTLDPDYGMVKEEIFHDDDTIPGWNDKIVAWIEEDVD